MTNDILPDDTNKDFENSLKASCHPSFIAENFYNDNVTSVDKALYYFNYYGVNTIPIPKPGEKLGEIWNEEAQKLVDIKADGKSAKGYGTWTGWQSKKQTTDDVIKLFDNKLNCNIAAITGKISKIIAFDIDGEEAQEYFDQIIAKINDQEIKIASITQCKLKPVVAVVNML